VPWEEGCAIDMLAEAAGTVMRSEVIAALKQASDATGSDFRYLLGTAMRESSLQPQAKSATSSASGLFQFVDQTWLGLVKQFGAKYGLASYAQAITKAPDGRFGAANAEDRHAILAMRNDPRISALMAGEYANSARTTLQTALGRDVSNGELYAAHFLGPDAACRLIRMRESQPASCAAEAFPQAAQANRGVFFHADGTAKSVREVYEWADRQPGGAVTSDDAVRAPTPLIAQSPLAAPVTLESGGGDWAAAELWSALQPPSASALSSVLLPQSPLAPLSGMFDILGRLGGQD
jgi:hypothetical protein